MRSHVRQCEQWQALYASDPGRALDPVAEYQRWLAEDRDDERVTRREDAVADAQQRRAAQQDRFSHSQDLAQGALR